MEVKKYRVELRRGGLTGKKRGEQDGVMSVQGGKRCFSIKEARSGGGGEGQISARGGRGERRRRLTVINAGFGLQVRALIHR